MYCSVCIEFFVSVEFFSIQSKMDVESLKAVNINGFLEALLLNSGYIWLRKNQNEKICIM